jgi:MscS family membrane protein
MRAPAAAAFVVAVALCALRAPVVPAAEPAPPEVAVPAEPWRSPLDYGPDTPRGALARFMTACRNGEYAKAAEYLNLGALPRAQRAWRGPELARALEIVLDRALWVDLEKLPADRDGDPQDGLPARRDSLGAIETQEGRVGVFIERVTLGNGEVVWKIASDTVAAIPALYAEFGWGPLARVLPAFFFETRLLSIRLWQWIGLGLLAAAAWALSWLVRGLLVRAVRLVLRWRAGPPSGLPDAVAEPLRLLLGVVVGRAGLPLLALAVPVHRLFAGALTSLAIVAMTWLFLRVLDEYVRRFETRLDRARHARAVDAAQFGRRTLKVFVVVVAFIAALQNFGFNVTGLLAGLGVGGLAVALAAQKTVENLFGSISLVADQPVRLGDVCRFGDTVGTVEDIGLRSTRIRTVARTLVTVPNAQFSTMAIENLSLRDRIPVRASVMLPQGTSAERVRALLVALRERVGAVKQVEAHSVSARFVRLDPQALEVECFAYVLTTRWEEYVEVREEVLLRALEVAGGEARVAARRD